MYSPSDCPARVSLSQVEPSSVGLLPPSEGLLLVEAIEEDEPTVHSSLLLLLKSSSIPASPYA